MRTNKSCFTRLLIFTCLLTLYSYSAFAQVDDIRNGADNNRKNGSSTGNNNTSTGNGSDAACAQACCDMFGTQMFQIMVAAVVEGQKVMLSVADDDPTIRSIDFDPQGAYNPQYESFLFLPRIRGTYGIFATEFRLNYLLGQGTYGMETFKSYEWQIIQLNLASRPHFNFRIGTGVYWQNYLSTVIGNGYITQAFNEHLAEISIKFDDQKYITTFCGRIALDYQTLSSIFSEFSVVQNIQFMKSSGFRGYYSLGLNVEKYYPSTRLVSIQAGLHFNLFSTSAVVKSVDDPNAPPSQY